MISDSILCIYEAIFFLGSFLNMLDKRVILVMTMIDDCGFVPVR